MLGKFQAHRSYSRSRQQDRDAHGRNFHYNFRRQPASGVEPFVVTFDVFQPHLAGNCIGGVVAANVFDKVEDFQSFTECAAVNSAGLTVDLVITGDIF